MFLVTNIFRSFCKQLTWPETAHTCLIYREVAFKFYTSNAEKVILLKSGYFCYNVVSTQPKKPAASTLWPKYAIGENTQFQNRVGKKKQDKVKLRRPQGYSFYVEISKISLIFWLMAGCLSIAKTSSYFKS